MFGQKIYYFRRVKGLTQEQLAQGICSVSHLSKIENGHEVPSPYISEHLCKKLNISAEGIDSEEELFSITQRLDEWYVILCHRDKIEATSRYALLKEQIAHLQDHTILLKFKILSLAYRLLLRDLDEARLLQTELEPFEKRFDLQLKYYYYLFCGYFAYLHEDYLKALQLYRQAEKIGEKLDVEDAEIYYHLALVNLHLHRTFYSIKLATLALDIYVKNCNYVRSIDCQNLLGINKTRIQDFEEAEKYFLNALQVSSLLDNKELISNSYHNIGYLSLTRGQLDIAIKNFLNSIEHFNGEQNENLVRTFYCLAKTYYKLNDYTAMKHWIEKGQVVAQGKNLIEFMLHFKFLTCLINPSDDYELEYVLKNEVIPYFEEKQIWYFVANYAERLAEYYSKQFKYKNSSQYYSLVNESRKKIYKYE